jgi:endonuclease YncB( thermonuclease family)
MNKKQTTPSHFIRKSKRSSLFFGILGILLAGTTITWLASPQSDSNNPIATNQTEIARRVAVNLLVTEMVKTYQAEEQTKESNIQPLSTNTAIEIIPVSGENGIQQIHAPGADCFPPNPIEVAVVSSIVDGDTIQVQMNGQEYKVRYIGIDAPESGTGNQASTATAANSAMTSGQTIMMVKDQSETDSFDRLLRYVVAGNGFVNYELVRQGYASAKDYPPDSACALNLATAMNEAQSNHLGLWIPTATSPAVIVRGGIAGSTSEEIEDTEEETSSSTSNCDPAYPTVCIPSPPPDLDCGDVGFKRFQVLQPDPHNFDRDGDGIGCES